MEFEERSRPALVAAIAADPAVADLPRPGPGRPCSTEHARLPERPPADRKLAGELSIDLVGVLRRARDPGRERPAVHRGRGSVERGSRDALGNGRSRVLAGGNAIGQVLRLTPDPSERFGREEEPPLSSQTFVVVGIARDVTGHPMGHPEARVYLPSPVTTADATIVLRVNGDTNVARRAIVGRLTAIDPNIGMVMMMRSVMAIGTYPLQVVFWIVVVLGSIALALTMSGIFGVLSYLVVQRTKEIGVRMALGATAGAVTRQLLGQALRLVSVGLAIGVGLAWAMSSVIMSVQEPSGSPGSMGAQLVSVINPFDAMAYAGSLTFIAMASVAAALIPALRAAWIDPIATLRHD